MEESVRSKLSNQEKPTDQQEAPGGTLPWTSLKLLPVEKEF
jgi:hypothetical protein